MLELPQTLRPPASFDAPEHRDGVDACRFQEAVDAGRDFPTPFVERVGLDQAQSHFTAWTDLAARALDSNVFLDPVFALAAARHVSARARPNFLLVWERDALTARKRLIALWPMKQPRLWPGSLIETWVHDYCCSGAPLLDRTRALAGLDAIAAFLRESKSPATILSMVQLRQKGPTLSLLRRFATLNRLPFELVGQYDRAALDLIRSGFSAPDLVSRKKKKELRRQARRLQEKGPVSIGVAREGAELAYQIEAFLNLEAKGWKVRDGGAFLNNPEHASFVRAMA
jgi:hypothetical protein